MRHAYDGLTAAEQLAVWSMRRLHGARRSCASGTVRRGLLSDLTAAVVALRSANALMITHQGLGLEIASPGHLALTDDERRLLRGTAASQAGDDRLVEIALFDIAANWRARTSLTAAVTLLGANLGSAGYWLPKPPAVSPLPPAALRVAWLHGADMPASGVAWP